ncbi:hypothetical protein ECC41_01720 [Helicobacter pylori]|nr:hypothetical protein ECC41_01720 [Helicobacter pylori]
MSLKQLALNNKRVGVFILTPLYFLMVISNMLGWCDEERLCKRRSDAYSWKFIFCIACGL